MVSYIAEKIFICNEMLLCQVYSKLKWIEFKFYDQSLFNKLSDRQTWHFFVLIRTLCIYRCFFCFSQRPKTCTILVNYKLCSRLKDNFVKWQVHQFTHQEHVCYSCHGQFPVHSLSLWCTSLDFPIIYIFFYR